MQIALLSVLAVNVLWFGLGFRLFSLQPRRAIRLLVPADAREERTYKALVEALPFLGGMNLAFAVLSLYALVPMLRGAAISVSLVLLACGLAHGSQFAANLPPLLRGGRAGGASWDVRGPMRFIFIVDGVCAAANLALWLVTIL
ncbi:MAG: hypothetical protein JST92_16330 [Deltaproteobacteria bacterium]|nr:hypothetical protein [Deltaproteobacteria bacterium]